ncbi:MAG TPA: cytochrome c oxidase subunit II [Planctomycetaceae bacterium]|nr:cytochrome c oxidase subunit II [Planctomycetaceae bacterium]
MKKFWALFFFFWPTVAIYACLIAPSRGWWFPGPPMSRTGVQIDGLFYLILIIVTITFVGTQYALGYVLWKGATKEPGSKAVFSHGSHKLEIMWTIVPSFVLVFISLSQLDVLAEIRVISSFPKDAGKPATKVAEVMARQFEWRIRYPKPGTELTTEPSPEDLYYVNELHVPTGKPVVINLRTQDVQHAFFAPQLRVKQDAVPGLVIPVWFDIKEVGEYDLVCAELCGWGHFKMKARIVAQSQGSVDKYLKQLEAEQNEDGTKAESAEE